MEIYGRNQHQNTAEGLNPQVTNLIHLARALAANLGYLRTRTAKDRRQLLMDDVEGANYTSQETLTSLGSERCEQWRALAGCFAITSVYGSHISCNEFDQYLISALGQ
jgi:hypothetical protein